MKYRRLTFALLLMTPMLAQAWWNADWPYRKALTIDTTPTGANVPVEVDSVPVLIRLHTGNFGYFLDVAEDARDLRFFAGDDTTALKFHVEKFDPINEMALIWVQVPKLLANSKDNRLWMYYGNRAATSAGDPAGTYGPQQTLVYHFNTQQTLPHDSTGYANQAVTWSGETLADSLIGAGAQFQAGAQLRVADQPALQVDPAKGWTVGFWFNVDALPQEPQSLLARGGEAGSVGLEMTPDGVVARLTTGEQTVATPAVGVTPGTWHHLSLVLNAEGLQLFLDGARAQTAEVSLPPLNGDIVLGQVDDTRPGFVGKLDELEIASVARAASWIAASVRAQSPGTTMVVYGEDSDQGSSEGGESYFLITLHNVTLDGWVVIVALAVMAAVSWVVMFNKGVVINRVRRDNRAFDQLFAQLSAGHLQDLDKEDEGPVARDESPLLTALTGKHDNFQSSTLYRIYHAGVQEVQHRLAKSVGARANLVLSPQAIGAIKATMDSVMTRESQRLNSQMVLLTIAISGGPFLGLLGTVVGVMITFAVIAATGDVNVNSIAPGIAAALVATVAGLAVAIPALFGYNYLGTRIKEIQSDMRVFADEFLAKVAEEYS